MGFLDVLGWVAACTGMVSGLPQLVRLLRERTSAGVSLPMWQLNVAALYAWSCHGFHIGQFSLLISNLLLAVTSTAVVVMICRDRGQPVWLKLIPPLLLSAFLFGVIDLLLGPLVYGLVAVLPLAVGQVTQFLDLRNSVDISGVSGGFLVVNLLVQALWLVWALLMREHAVTAASTVMTTLTALNLGFYLWRAIPGRGRGSSLGQPAQ
ncbi:hypothetical protein EII34_08800 [Arachnia propionica]|uniref:Uncharacterized protein n=1 Tax=Arachnia propionica TaxID=1750 RepID=A0A3P1T755_9ACTN|nr:PQ-loop domain-containing transporter [Arachnia propionica]MDO5083812.1 PQ-loop domain-containing transporter [Arachnia propionica]RRD05005.1 hypothetical protein EII34_08800 [Arachnia propionica]